jgi:hypothetical protein
MQGFTEHEEVFERGDVHGGRGGRGWKREKGSVA